MKEKLEFYLGQALEILGESNQHNPVVRELAMGMLLCGST